MPEPDDLAPRTERMPPLVVAAPRHAASPLVPSAKAGPLERALLVVAAAAIALPWDVALSDRALRNVPFSLAGLELIVPAVAIVAVVSVLRQRPMGSRLVLGLGAFGVFWRPFSVLSTADTWTRGRPAFSLALASIVCAAGALVLLGIRERRRDTTEATARRAARSAHVAAFALPAMAYLSSSFWLFGPSGSFDDAGATPVLALLVTLPLVLVAASLASPSRRRFAYRLGGLVWWMLVIAPLLFDLHRRLHAPDVALLVATTAAALLSPLVLYYDASRSGVLGHEERRAAWAAPLRVAGVAGVGLIVFFALLWLPCARIDAARSALIACDDAPDDPDSTWAQACRARAQSTMSWAKRVPWLKTRAQSAEQDALEHHQGRALEWSTLLSPNRRGRDAAVRSLCARNHTVAARVGAFELAAACMEEPSKAADADITVLALGADVVALTEASKNAGPSTMTEPRRAALACLLGQRRDAIPWLRARGPGANEVAYACGLEAAELGYEPTIDMDLAFAFTPHARAGGLSAAEALRAGKRRDASKVSFLVVLARALADGEAGAADALGGPGADFLADPPGNVDETFSAIGATPWRLVGELSRFAAIPTDTLEQGALRLEALAAASTAANERRALTAEAYAMWLLAAQERARRGDFAGATASLARSDLLAERQAGLWSSAMHLAVRDGRGALAHADAFLSGAKDPLDRAVATMQRAVALTVLGKKDEAAAAAASAASALSGYDAKTRAGHQIVRASAWLACSTSLHSSYPSPAGVAAMKIVPLGEWSWEVEWDRQPAYLCGKTFESAAQRRATRARFPTLTIGGAEASEFAPAAFDVVAALAEGTPEPSVWLDAAVKHDFGPIALRGTMLLRADAARWRGDEEDAKRWDERFQRIAHLVRDERTAVLARTLGW
jgi:hypothetical protein